MTELSALQVKKMLGESVELAFIDVREHGQYTAGHPFFSVSIPFSVFEHKLPVLVPNPAVALVLFDNNNGIAERAAEAAQQLGYRNTYILEDGVEGWSHAGFKLFEGVNLPSKTFGEILEHQRNTPRISATELSERAAAGENLIILDGRPYSEFQKMSIPGATCCPNGELVYRYQTLVPDPKTTVVINCAGRTRSIVGAQTLIDLGVPNPVVALENGTQGWFLAGLQLNHGATERYPEVIDSTGLEESGDRLAARLKSVGISRLTGVEVSEWLADNSRTTYLCDVRTANEFADNGIPGSVHTPGGQLVQSTDSWIAVRNARIILMDHENLRASAVALWLYQMGWQVAVANIEDCLAAGVETMCTVSDHITMPKSVTAAQVVDSGAVLMDLRSSAEFRNAHILGARWAIRPEVKIDPTMDYVLIGAPDVVSLVARDIWQQTPDARIRWLDGDMDQWRADGVDFETTPGVPTDQSRIDFNFHTHDRHQGNAAAARAYLAWETGLVEQIDDQESGLFRFI